MEITDIATQVIEVAYINEGNAGDNIASIERV